MREILNLAESRDLKIIEDCALAVGSRHSGTHVGLFGHAGCFSFYPVKHITTAEGGMFVSRHRQISDKVARLRAFHVDRSAGQGIPGTYDVTGLGLNYRMSEVQAALGRSQLSRINENLAKRKGNFTRLKEKLTRFADHVRVLDTVDGLSASSHYCLVAVLQGKLREDRNTFVKRLNQQGVGTSVYYPAPVPKMAYYRLKYGYEPVSFANAEEISTCSIALPIGTHVEHEDIDYIAGVFEQTVKETIA